MYLHVARLADGEVALPPSPDFIELGSIGDGHFRGAPEPHHSVAFLRGLLQTAREIAWQEPRLIEVVNELFGMAGLQPLLDDPTVETINANRFDRVFVQYNDGRRAPVAPIAGSNEELTDLVRLLAARASSQERRFDQGSPAVNLQLPGGERLFAVMGLTAGGVTALSIRRHGYLTVTLPELRRRGTLDPGLEACIWAPGKGPKHKMFTGGHPGGETPRRPAGGGHQESDR